MALPADLLAGPRTSRDLSFDQPSFPNRDELNDRQQQEEQDRLSNVAEMINDKIIRDSESCKLGRALADAGQDNNYRPLKRAEHLFPRGGLHGNVLQKGKKLMLPDRLLQRIRGLREENFMFGGVLPEIHRAWISIDHVLYLWNYSDGQQYEVYDALDQLIITVGLVKAREGVFLDQTEWLLVVTTPTEVVALAVLFENPNDSLGGPVPAKSRLVLQPTAVCVSTDNNMMLKVLGTPCGRIFMGGRDGCLYELVYGIESDWMAGMGMARKCRKMNHSATGDAYRKGRSMMMETMKFLGASALANKVFGPENNRVKDMCYDPSRKLLFMLVENETGCLLEGFRVPSANSGTGLIAFCTKTGVQMERWAQGLVTGDLSKPDAFVSICPGPPRIRPEDDPTGRADEQEVHLVLLAQSGMRFFLRTVAEPNGSLIDVVPASVAPFPLNEILSRQLESARVGNFSVDSDATRSYLSPSLCLLSAAEGSLQPSADGKSAARMTIALGRSSSLKTSASNNFVMQAQRGVKEDVEVMLSEDVDSEGLPLRVLAVAESCFPFGCSLWRGSSLSDQSAHLNELGTQQHQWPREVLFLVEDGLQSYLKLRPLDWLAIYLQHGDPRYHSVLAEFFVEYGKDEACAMCYSLACTDFGSLPRESVLRIVDIEAVRRNAKALLTGGSAVGDELIGNSVPIGQQTAGAVYQQSVLAVPQWTRNYSERFNGLQLYAARLLSGIWRQNITIKHPNGTQDLYFPSPEHWQATVAGLDKLLSLLEELYPGDMACPIRPAQSTGGEYQNMIQFYQQRVQQQDARNNEAKHAETSVVFAMYKLLQLSRQASRLFFHLAQVDGTCQPGEIRCRFVDLSGALEPAEQIELEQLTFQQLISKLECRQEIGGKKPVLRKLVQQLVLMPNHRELAGVLKVECPSFFAHEDDKRMEADQKLIRASQTSGSLTPEQRQKETAKQLEEAVALYRQVGRYIECKVILNEYTGLVSFGWYAAAVELVMLKAQHITDQQQRDLVLNNAIDVMHQVWRRKVNPDDPNVSPPLSAEQIDQEWCKCLTYALDLGQPRLLRDVGSWHCTVFDMLFHLHPARAGRDELVSLPVEHFNLVQGTLFNYLERDHMEHLYQAYRAAGMLEKSAEKLFIMATETDAERVLRNAEPIEDLVETRILWLAQAALDMQALGLGSGRGSTMPNMLHEIQDSKAVLQVQRCVRDALQSLSLSIPSTIHEYCQQLKLGVCDTVYMWQALNQSVDRGTEQIPLWRQHGLYRECLLILNVLEFDSDNERFKEQVREIWRCVADCRDGSGNSCRVETRDGAEHWRRSIFDGDSGSLQRSNPQLGAFQSSTQSIRHINQAPLQLRPHSACFPLEFVLLQLEQKHMQVLETLQLDFKHAVWVANKICGWASPKCTSATYQEAYQAYMKLLRDPSIAGNLNQDLRANTGLLQVHLLGVVALLLRDWLSSPNQADQNMLRSTHIDHDELVGIMNRNLNCFNPNSRNELGQLLQAVADQLNHLSW